jgi:hypothetical protein
MSITVAKYTFSSWLRKGIGITINETDNLGTGTSPVKERSTIPIDVLVNTKSVHKDFALIGPGDIIGINPHMIVRTEPRNWITNFEPNYLAFIEFYDEDFIWRYTPAKADGDKLRPWIMLAVLKQGEKDDESEFTVSEKKLPLPTVTVKSADSLPANTQIWAWSHVHINDGYNSTNEFEQFLQSLHDLNNPNSDKIISRLMSPRKLDSNSAYRVFVIPAFETGRLGGLGLDTTTTDAQMPSYKAGDKGIEFPYYYEWYFRTGDNEDFENLVRLLEPRPMDKRVGIRDMDGSKPGFGMTEGTNIGAILPPTENQMIIGLEGALESPDTESKPPAIDTSKPFFPQLRDIVNFPAELQKSTNSSSDPVVSPPIYGENHALTYEINITNAGWLHGLNKDPRNRTSSGFGTNVVQKNQDSYLSRAWDQVQKILDANRKILFTAFSMNFVQAVKNNFISKLQPEKTLVFFSPVLKKIKGSPTTLHYQLEQSNIPSASVSTAFRRIIRPRGPFFEKLRSVDVSFNHGSLLKDLNSLKISAAPPKKDPTGIQILDKIAANLPGSSYISFIKFILKYRLWFLIILLLIFLVLAVTTGSLLLFLVLAIAAIAGYFSTNYLKNLIEEPATITDPNALVTVIQDTPQQSNFKFIETDPVVPVASTAGTSVTTTTTFTSTSANATKFSEVAYFTPTTPGQDSLEAMNFRSAATDLNKRLTVKAPVKTAVAFNMNNSFQKLSAATDPRVVFPKQLASLVHFSFNPSWLLDPEKLIPAMAYPDFEDPMYEKLRDISSELLIPNLNLIPPNTISLLVTNPVFIESYMVGLNHEFGKELLWKEYPTDERGSYFRQFWDVKGIITNETGLTPEQLTEKYKDITPLDTWHSASLLGDHNNRNISGNKQVVLVVRGELLKKYPNTIIYAQKAHIYKDSKGNADATKEPVIIEVSTDVEMKTEIKFPIFKAEVNPDIKFFGFDLTIPQAKGDDNPTKESDDWGWYFIIQQIPGEPRFGMDISFTPDDPMHVTWDDLSWDKYVPTKSFIDTTVKPGSGFVPAGPGENINQWGNNSSMMANILYQKPVMIAVHAKEMLENLNN